MWDVLRRFRRQKEISVELSNLSEWFSRQQEAIIAPLERSFQEERTALETARGNIMFAMDALSGATLHNPNVSSKELQFMEGNRNAYLTKVRALINTLSTPPTVQEGAERYEQLAQRMVTFASSSGRAYYVLSAFFAHEAKDIAIGVKELEVRLMACRQLHARYCSLRLDEITTKVQTLHQLLETRKALHGERVDMRQAVAEHARRIKELNAKRESIIASDAYGHTKHLNHELQRSAERMKQKEDEFRSEFSPLANALRKYGYAAVEHQRLAYEYADDPLATIVTDLRLEIVDILDRLRERILDGTLELKDRTRSKALDAVERLNRNMLSSFLTSYNALAVRHKELTTELERNETLQELTSVDTAIEEATTTHGRAHQRIGSIDERLAPDAVQSAVHELEDELSAICSSPVRILGAR